MIFMHLGLVAWQATMMQTSHPSMPIGPVPEFDSSIAGEEDPGSSIELPPEKPGDEVSPGVPGTGSAPCPTCGGRGVDANGQRCAQCNGTGTVTVTVGDA